MNTGELVVRAGGVVINAILDDNGGGMTGGLKVSAGGTAIGTTVNSGGFDHVFFGGIDSSAVVSLGGLQTIDSRGTASGATLNGGEQDVFGTASGTIVSSGGLQVVESGGVANASIVNSAGICLQGGKPFAQLVDLRQQRRDQRVLLGARQ
jgi:autotransporter passenger strand-loop-strand repeat protein